MEHNKIFHLKIFSEFCLTFLMFERLKLVLSIITFDPNGIDSWWINLQSCNYTSCSLFYACLVSSCL